MFTAKDIKIKLIDSKSANALCKRLHYSGKVVPNSQIHFGVFLKETLQGVLQFGPSTNKRRMVENLGIGFNEFIELNRMALSDACPKNSESRALGICLRTLKKSYPHIKLVVSFADGCQCGDGTIYRASGFKLLSFKKNTGMRIDEKGNVYSQVTFSAHKPNEMHLFKKMKVIEGVMFKYLYFFDKGLEKRFKFVDFDNIPEDVKMYKGLKRSELDSKASSLQLEESGATPTTALHLQDKLC